MNEITNESSASGSIQPLRQWQRFSGIFASPRRTLEDIAQKPDWLAPFVVILLATILLTQLCLPAILSDAEKAMDRAMEKQQLAQEQMEKSREMATTYTKNFSAITAGIFSAMGSVIAASTLLFVGNIVIGGKASFRQVFSIYVWTGLVGLLSYLLRAPLALKQLTMKVYFGPALFFPPEAEESALFRIAAALDIFSIWRIILVAIGFAAIYRLSLGKSLAVVGSLYVLLVASSVAFGGFMGR